MKQGQVAGQKPGAQPPGATAQNSDGPPVVQVTGVSNAVLWHACYLLSEGRIDELVRYAEDAMTKGEGAHAPYQVLFGYYRLRGDKDAFEAVSVRYVVSCEVLPPVWIDIEQVQPSAPTSIEKVPVQSLLSDDIIALSIRLENTDPLCLDFSSLTKADIQGLDLFNQALSERIERKEITSVERGDILLQLIAPKAIQAGQNKQALPVWKLLFEITMLLPDKAFFEKLKAKFGEIFKAEPAPVWTDRTAIIRLPIQEKQHRNEQIMKENEVVLGDKVNVRECYEACKDKGGSVRLDFRHVKIMDFSVAHDLARLARKLKDEKIELAYINVNELFHAMLRASGVHQFAKLSVPALPAGA